MYARHLQPILRELLGEFRIVYLAGPRQAGKTTLVRSIAQELGLDYLTLDNQATLASVESDPHGFVRSLGSKRVVLDEFQYAPALIPAIKEASDQLASRERGKFLLTGSADIFRSAQTQEALPGHMARVELLPLSVAELSGSSVRGAGPSRSPAKGSRSFRVSAPPGHAVRAGSRAWLCAHRLAASLERPRSAGCAFGKFARRRRRGTSCAP